MSVIKRFRTEKKLNQAQFAKYLGCSQGLVSAMESGRRAVSKDTARLMSSDPEIGQQYPLVDLLFGDGQVVESSIHV